MPGGNAGGGGGGAGVVTGGAGGGSPAVETPVMARVARAACMVASALPCQ
jgi:hypothetical protein